MTSTLALLGFLVLIFLLVYPGLVARARRSSQVHKPRHRSTSLVSGKIDQRVG